MDIFSLAAKISIDTNEYEEGVKKASTKSNTLKKSIDSIGNGISAAERTLSGIARASETLATALDKAGDVSETVKNKISLLAVQYDKAQETVKDLEEAFNKSAKETGVASKETLKLAAQLSNAEDIASKFQGALEAMTSSAQTSAAGMDNTASSAQSAGTTMSSAWNKILNIAQLVSDGIEKIGLSAETSENMLGVLTERYNAAEAEVTRLTEAFNNSVRESGYASDETQELANQLSDAASKASGFKKEIDSITQKAEESSEAMDGAGEAMADVGEAMDDAGDKSVTFGDMLKANLASEAIIEGAKKIVDVIGEIGKAFFEVGKQSLDSYADYEQLEGGIRTLFGDSADTVLENAKNAFQTAGMSANEYLDTVMSFSSSLIQSTGRGAQQDLELLENTLDEEYTATKRSLEDQYNERKNYYDDLISNMKQIEVANVEYYKERRDEELTALKRSNEDKLKELKSYNEEQLKAAETANNLSINSAESLQQAADLSDMAIKDMSDNVNKFGSDMGSLQNAYEGFAKQNFTMLDNLKLGYGGTKEEMERLLADAERLPDALGQDFDISNYADIITAIHLIQEEMGITGTTAVEASTTIEGSVSAMKAAWQNLVTGFADENANLDTLIGTFVDSFSTAGDNIIPKVEKIMNRIGETVEKLAPIIEEKLPELMDAILPGLVSATTALIEALAANAPEIFASLIKAANQVIDEIGNGLAEKIPFLSGLFENLEFVVSAVTGAMIAYKASMAISKVIEMLTKATEGQTVAQTLLNAVMNANPFTLVATAIGALVGVLVTLWSTNEGFRNAVKEIWDGIISAFEGAVETITGIIEKIKDAFGSVVDGVKNLLGIHSPSRVFAGIGENMALGLGEGWDNEFSRIKGQIEGGMDFGTTSVGIDAISRPGLNGSDPGGQFMNVGSQNQERDIVINLTADLDGMTLARKMVRYNQKAQDLIGPSLVKGPQR